MARYVFDIEADGLLDTISKVHSLVLKDIDTGEAISCHSQATENSIEYGIVALEAADLLIGHNIISYDIPALMKIHPWMKLRQDCILRDTLVMAKLIFPMDRLMEMDRKTRQFPGRLTGRQSLEAWGWRIGERKMEFEGPWDKWTPEMQTYCEQDVETNHKLYSMLAAKGYSEQAIQLEHDVQEIIFRLEQAGAPFSEEKGRKLYATLAQTRMEREKELVGLFPPWYRPGAEFTPKRDNKRLGYVAGAPAQKIELTEFNPGSRDHIADRLMKKYGWKPRVFTGKGKPQIDEVVISKLEYPEAKKLLAYLLVQKRIGQLAEGDKALLKHVKDGRIHGEINPLGTATRRGSHHNPNLGQIPKVKKKAKEILYGEAGEWGFEFRDCFTAPIGWRMIGCDESGLEMRMLAHYMAQWDGGEYAKEVLAGDIHSVTMQALGIDDRDMSKIFLYAYLYGAGDVKLGKILKAKNAKVAGAAARAKFQGKLSALGKLVAAVKHRHHTKGYLVTLDGGLLYTRSEHSALNTLLQGAGAIVCKVWLVLTDRALREAGYQWGKDQQLVLWVHDEQQFLSRPAIADDVARIARECARRAGEVLNLRVPLDGTSSVGGSWSETH